MKRIIRIFSVLLDSLTNFLSTAEVFLITEDSNWVVKEEGNYLKKYLEKYLKSRSSLSPYCIENKIVHFLSISTYIGGRGPKKVSPTNKIIVSWFHVEENDQRLQYIPVCNPDSRKNPPRYGSSQRVHGLSSTDGTPTKCVSMGNMLAAVSGSPMTQTMGWSSSSRTMPERYMGPRSFRCFAQATTPWV